MTYRRPLFLLVGLGILLILLVVDHWIFTTWFHTTHLKWYLANGALIGLVSSLAALAWGDMNKHTGLISAHPFDYIGACLQLAGLPIYALGTHLKSNHQGGSEPANPFDLILGILLSIALAASILLWVVVIAPVQYFVTLICGAPARLFSKSQRQPIAQLKGAQLHVSEMGSHERPPEGWWSASIGQKPVAVTNLFASLLFLVTKPLLG